MKTAIRQALPDDLPQIVRIVAQAQEALRQAGIDQWQDGYPTPEIFRQDIAGGNLHLLFEQGGDDQPLGTMTLTFDPEPSYAPIRACASGAPMPSSTGWQSGMQTGDAASPACFWLMQKHSAGNETCGSSVPTRTGTTARCGGCSKAADMSPAAG